MTVLPQILFPHTPDGVLFIREALHPSGLLFLGDMQEKLHHEVAVIRQLTFKTPHALDALCIFFLGKLLVKALFHHLIHPAGI